MSLLRQILLFLVPAFLILLPSVSFAQAPGALNCTDQSSLPKKVLVPTLGYPMCNTNRIPLGDCCWDPNRFELLRLAGVVIERVGVDIEKPIRYIGDRFRKFPSCWGQEVASGQLCWDQSKGEPKLIFLQETDVLPKTHWWKMQKKNFQGQKAQVIFETTAADSSAAKRSCPPEKLNPGSSFYTVIE